MAIDGSKFKAVNNRDKNFTDHKRKARIAQIEKSIGRYLTELDRADRAPNLVTETRVSRLKEKMVAAKAHIQKLQQIGEQLQNAPDKQLSLTDPDARSMATSGRGTGIVGYNVQTAAGCVFGWLFRCWRRYQRVCSLLIATIEEKIPYSKYRLLERELPMGSRRRELLNQLRAEQGPMESPRQQLERLRAEQGDLPKTPEVYSAQAETLTALMIWVVFCGSLLVFGLTIRWVYRGFRDISPRDHE